MSKTVVFLVAFGGVAMAGAPVERRVHPERVLSSSYLKSDWNRFTENYHPNYVGDDDPKTAWTEGADHSGAGEWLQIPITSIDNASGMRLQIRNGYQKSKRLFKRNARAKKVQLRALPSGEVKEVTLKDSWGWQQVVVPAKGTVTGVEIKVLSVYEGSHYTDLCISDVQVFITSTVAENPSLEKGKRAKLIAWKKARVDAAKTFKKKGSKLPIGSSYSVAAQGDGKLPETYIGLAKSLPRKYSSFPKEYASWDGDFQDSIDEWTPVRVTLSDKRDIPPVDGIEPMGLWDWGAGTLFVPNKVAYFNTGKMRRLYDGKAVSAKAATSCEGFDESAPKVSTFTRQRENEALRELLVVKCAMVEERDGEYPEQTYAVYHYDGEGQIDWMLTRQSITNFQWKAGVIAAASRFQPGDKAMSFSKAEK